MAVPKSKKVAVDEAANSVGPIYTVLTETGYSNMPSIIKNADSQPHPRLTDQNLHFNKLPR